MTVTALDPTEAVFAELVARIGLEPELAGRYATDPAAVCRELGVDTTQQQVLDTWLAAPAPLAIEHLDRPDPGVVAWCVLCTGTVAPGSPDH